MAWSKKELIPPLPPEIQDIVDFLSNNTAGVAFILEKLVELLDKAQIFLTATTDLFAVIMEILIQTVEELINDLFSTGLYQLVINPFTITNTNLRRACVNEGTRDQFSVTFITPDDAIKLAINSFDDPGDIDRKAWRDAGQPERYDAFLKRPNFSDNAYVSGFGLLITAKDINLYISLLEKMLALWALGDVKSSLDNAKKKKFGEPPPSTGVDWDSMRLNQVDSLADIQNQLLKILSLARGYTNVPRGIIDLIGVIKKKLDTLRDLVLVFQAVIDDLSQIQNLGGVHFLDIPPQKGGNSLIKASLPNPVLQTPENFVYRYTMFLLYVGGGPNIGAPQLVAADQIRSLFASAPNFGDQNNI